MKLSSLPRFPLLVGRGAGLLIQALSLESMLLTLLCFLAMSMACASSRAKDQICATAVIRAIAVTMPDP